MKREQKGVEEGGGEYTSSVGGGNRGRPMCSMGDRCWKGFNQASLVSLENEETRIQYIMINLEGLSQGNIIVAAVDNEQGQARWELTNIVQTIIRS